MHPIQIRSADPESSAAVECLSAYFQLLCENIPGITTAHVPLPDPDSDAYRPPLGQFLIAWRGDLPEGCVSLHALDTGVGEVKRLWVAPAARGHGIARALMAGIESHARAAGMRTLKLDTHKSLTAAITLYRASGWTDAAPYSRYPATHWFEKTL